MIMKSGASDSDGISNLRLDAVVACDDDGIIVDVMVYYMADEHSNCIKTE